jgi:hypothetical protein
MDLEEIAWGGMDWIDLASGREQRMAREHDNELSGPKVGKF